MHKSISIIIPVFNSKDRIDNCLKSLNSQTSNDFEVVFVDDFSSDDSIEYIKTWIKENGSFDYRIICNKKNSGPGPTRNHGIRESIGDYIVFMDSDDMIESNYIEESLKILRKKKTDLILYDYYISKKESNKLSKSCLVKEYGNINASDALALCNGMCWGKVYKKSIIIENNIEFPSLMRSEDLVFVKKYISYCKSVFYSDKAMYHYFFYQNDKSIMHNKSTLDTRNNEIAFNMIKKINQPYPMEMVFVREYLYLITQIKIIKGEKNKEIKKFINNSVSEYPNWYKNKYIKYQPLYLRILLFFIRIKFITPLRIVFMKKGV